MAGLPAIAILSKHTNYTIHNTDKPSFGIPKNMYLKLERFHIDKQGNAIAYISEAVHFPDHGCLEKNDIL